MAIGRVEATSGVSAWNPRAYRSSVPPAPNAGDTLNAAKRTHTTLSGRNEDPPMTRGTTLPPNAPSPAPFVHPFSTLSLILPLPIQACPRRPRDVPRSLVPNPVMCRSAPITLSPLPGLCIQSAQVRTRNPAMRRSWRKICTGSAAQNEQTLANGDCVAMFSGVLSDTSAILADARGSDIGRVHDFSYTAANFT